MENTYDHLQALTKGQIALIHEKSVELDVEEDLPLNADEFLMRRLFTNLIDNAIKFTPEGGTINVRLMDYLADSGYPVLQALPQRSNVHSTSTQSSGNLDEGFISLEIADSGSGVKQANYKKMFQRFYREEQSRGLKPGNGLGLSMVYATMNLHRGAILVADNQPGLIVRLVFKMH